MNIEEAFTVAADPATTWDLIRDPACMMTCVPGCETIERLDDDRYRAEVAVGVGPIKARFNLLVTVLEERPLTFVRSTTEGEEGSRASLVKSNNEVRLIPRRWRRNRDRLPGRGNHQRPSRPLRFGHDDQDGRTPGEGIRGSLQAKG